MIQNLPIIIIGGGIGGITAAIALAQKGITSLILEQASQLRETGAGIQLCPNVFKMFDHLGITKSLTEIAIFPDNLVYYDGIIGEEFLRISLGADLLRHFQYPYGVFHREELLRTLAKEAQKYPQIQIITSTRVIEVAEHNGTVLAKLDHGTIYEGEALIGCDGLWSVVRNYIVGKERPRVSGHVCYRGVIQKREIPEHLRPNNVCHWVRDNAHLVHYPIGTQGLFNIVAIFQTDRNYEAEDIKGDREELQNKFRGSCPEIMEILMKVDGSRKWMLCDRDPISEWSKSRMTLLGDSAHPTLPYLTQGAGMAIEDAVVLAQRIVDYDKNYAEAFKAYQKERYLRTGYVQLFSRAYGESHHSRGVARELRNQLIAERTPAENYAWLGHIYKGIEVKGIAAINRSS